MLKEVTCLDYSFKAGMLGDGYFIQVIYAETDVHTGIPETQRCRKWYVSQHAVPSEVIQTCLKAVLTSMEHRAREHFHYKGVALFGPHLDVEALRHFVSATAEERR